MPDQSAKGNVPTETPSGPRKWPLVGASVPFFRRPFEHRRTVAREYGDVVDISGLGQEVYLVSHPDDIERVLVSEPENFQKPAFEKRFLRRAFGDSMTLVEGERWRHARQVSQPVFTMDRIQRYGETMARLAHDQAEEWEDGAVIDVAGAMRDLTFSIFVETMFGLDHASVPDLRADFEAISKKLRLRHAIVPDWLPTSTNRRYRTALSRLETLVDSLIEDRRVGADDGDDLLGQLLEANEGSETTLSDERLRDEIMGFLFAGHETTAMTLSFAWYLLATSSATQERLQREVDDVVGGDRPGITDLDDLEYVEWVTDETLRLYPANHLIPREATEDVVLGGFRIPAGASVYCSQWIVHRDDRWWDQPEAFDPTRWEDAADRPAFAYFPFGGGPRHCIGMRFARLELRLAIATIAQQVSFAPVTPDQEPPSLAAGLSTHPKEPIELVVRRRDR